MLTLWLLVPGASASAQERAPTETITLRQLLQRALNEPPRVLGALAALQRTQADLRVAQGSYLPTLTVQGTGGITYDDRPQVSGSLVRVLTQLNENLAMLTGQPAARLTPRIDSVSLQTGVTANMDWSVVNLARGRAVEAGKRASAAQRESVGGVQRQALAAASELYMRALAASQLVADAELTYERRSQQHQGIAGLVKAGLRPPVDETRARIEAVAARYRVEVRKVEERASFAALAVSVGRDPRRPLRPEPLESTPFAVPSNLNDTVALALDHRPELRSLQLNLSARQAELRSAYYRRAPTLGVLGNAGASYINLISGQGITGAQYNASALGYLRWQGLDAAVWRSADVARANMLQAQRDLETAWLDVQAEVAEANFAVETTRAELARAGEVLGAAREAREAQNGRYKTGVASLLELLDAEGVEQNARLERIEAERNHELAKIRLLSATGLINKLAK